MPLETPQVKPAIKTSVQKIAMPSTPSAATLAQTFDVAQLPPLDDNEGGPVGETIRVDTAKKEVIPTKIDEGKTPPDKVLGEEVKVEEDKKEEKKEETPSITKHLKPPIKEGEKKEEVKVDGTKQITVSKKDEFDYAGFSQEEVNHLKNMAVSSRKYTGDLIKQNKELAKQKDSQYLQHPDAYTLDPQYKAGMIDIQYAQKEAQYWSSQLELAKLGKPIRQLLQWDDKGNPVVGPEIKGNDQTEEALRLNYQNAVQVANNIRTNLQQFPQKYQNQIKNDMQIITAKKNELFEWNAKPELMDYSIAIEGIGDRSIKQIKEDFKSLWPPYLANTIGVDTAADLMVALRIRDSELAEARASKQVTDTKMEEVKRAEPSSQVKPGKELELVHGVKEFSTAGLPEGL